MYKNMYHTFLDHCAVINTTETKQSVFFILNLSFRVEKSGTSGGEQILKTFQSTCSQSLEEKK